MKKLIIDFGKHKGKDLDDVPASYLLWMFDNPTFKITKPEIWDYIERNLKAIKEDATYEYCDATEIDLY